MSDSPKYHENHDTNIPSFPTYTLAYLREERALCVRYCYRSDFGTGVADTYRPDGERAQENYTSGHPTEYRLYWPILECSPAEAECYALETELSGRDEYGYAVGTAAYRAWPRVRFSLLNGGKTIAIRVEALPLTQPKVRKGIEVRFHGERWEKWSKSDRCWVGV